MARYTIGVTVVIKGETPGGAVESLRNRLANIFYADRELAPPYRNGALLHFQIEEVVAKEGEHESVRSH